VSRKETRWLDLIRPKELSYFLVKVYFFCGCGEDNNMELTRANEFRKTHTNTRAKRENMGN